MTDHDGTDGHEGPAHHAARNERDEKLGQALDLVKTPFYAWIGAGVRTVEILGDIGARVRAEEESRDGVADVRDDADADAETTAGKESGGIAEGVAGRVRDARRKFRDLGDNAGEQSREAFLNALEAAQEAFNDAVSKAQAGGDRAFASAQALPDDVAARAEQLKPEQLRAIADGYLEAASKIYRELAARGERAVDDGVNVAKERGASLGAGFPGPRAAGDDEGEAKDGEKGSRRGADPVSAIFGKLPFAGAAAERVAGSIEDVARETVKPLQDAGQEFLGRFDQEKVATQVESLLHQAADITEQLLGALRAEDAASGAAADGDVVDAEPDVVDGEVVAEAAADGAADAEETIAEADEAVADAAETADEAAEAAADASGDGDAADESAEDDADR